MVTAFFDRGSIWVENTYIKKCSLVTITPTTLCAQYKRAPSSEFEVSCNSNSPVKACSGGSMHTLRHTSVNRLAVKSLRSLWHTDGNPPVGQVRAWSVVKELPQTQWLGRFGGCHL